MRSLILMLSVVLVSSGQKKDLQIEKGFKQIDTYYSDRENLIGKIVPNQKYVYWKCVHSAPYINGESNEKLVVQSGDSLFLQKYKIEHPEQGFFNGCLPSWCFYYIMYVDNNKVNYLINDNDLSKFIGKIDNLEEALMLSKINGFSIDFIDIRGGAYRKTEKGYEFYLMKYNSCPETKESIKVEIDFQGTIKYKSQGVYYKTDVCPDY